MPPIEKNPTTINKKNLSVMTIDDDKLYIIELLEKDETGVSVYRENRNI